MAERSPRLRFLDWTVVIPVLALVVLGLTWGRALPSYVVGVISILLAGAVLASVHHA
jgi:Ca2+:H+ antiporter